ncbi:MAG TPA: adenylate/guanylate cyclase domain-containing protein, partial [Candidatus Ozemobacteraceae bacterium]|nr:adenylate/guanylate cyclase domain-containing protein [Candidatus Ozemobacteraceae bacterium]
FFEKKTSVWMEHIPELAAMTRALNHGGGQIKTRFQRGEKTFYCAGRRLKAFDWACLAIKEAAPAGGFFDRSLLVISMIMGYVLLIMGFAGYYFNQIFIKPVGQLSKGVYEMAQGNYDLRIETETDDEIGRMCQSFNHMGASLKEKEFLSRFLSDIAMDAISGKLSERATRVSGTVLFSDIRDFTTITEKNEPEEVVEMLNDYMTAMEEAIESESGTIEKFIGDAIMAVFLPAIGLKNPVIRATKAAEKMQTALAELNAKRSEKGQFAISNGVGIATGQLLMGVMGNDQGRRDFTVTGITVRLAATMEKYSRKARSRKIILCPHSAEIAAGAEIKSFKMKDEDAFELA